MRFGLCDDQNGTAAYIDTENSNKWIATVINEKNIPLIFTVIDKGVIKDSEEPDRGRCDCMLTSKEHLFFVELKNKKPTWQIETIEQLESTIKFFIANHDSTGYRHKKAFGCNRKRPQFYVIESEIKARFYELYKFRIDLQGEIKFP
ncbi:MAG: hypothetical protein LBR47_07600 [Spirochaetaceae bacterium]|jgi:hypothetical protein|nr:hypothetical protein [Spirochaetaceae bacterium]